MRKTIRQLLWRKKIRLLPWIPGRGSVNWKFSYKEQKEYETIEDDIAALEQKIEELDAQTLKFSSDFVKLNEITKEKEQTEQLLEEKMERWEYLEDLAAKIAGQQ